MQSQLGIVEGYYGRPWSWRERAETIAFLALHEYRFYIYAPKADEFLRRNWREPHPQDDVQELRRLSRYCCDLGVRFGVGLSPYELFRAFDSDSKRLLAAKLRVLGEIGLDSLAVLFDDMRGDLPGLAETQT